jgi:hypothetical protein
MKDHRGLTSPSLAELRGLRDRLAAGTLGTPLSRAPRAPNGLKAE